MLHHYYWARSEGESKKMKDMGKNIVRLDGEISKLRGDYHQKKAGLTTIIQKLM